MTPRPSSLLLSIVVACVCVLSMSATALAQSSKDLMKFAPVKSGALLGLDVENSKNTGIYSVGMEMLKDNKEAQRALSLLKSRTGFDIEKDAKTLLFSAPSPKQSGKPSRNLTLVVRGTFDMAQIDASLKKDDVASRKAGKFEVFSLSKRSEIVWATKDVAVFTTGSSSYREAALKTLSGSSAKVSALGNSRMTSLIKRVDTAKNLWFVAHMNKLKDANGPQLKKIAMTLDFAKGLGIDGQLTMMTEEDAVGLKKAFDDNRQKITAGLALMGGPSLMKNLSFTQSGSRLTIRSSMPESEVRALAKQAINMVKQSQQSRRSRPKTVKPSEAAPKASTKP